MVSHLNVYIRNLVLDNMYMQEQIADFIRC
jgi:hypothetical protein